MNGTLFTGMKGTIFILIGKEVIKIQIKEFRGVKYVNIDHGNTTEKDSGKISDADNDPI